MRILLLSNLYRPYILGGAEVVAADIGEGLEKLGHEVFVLTSSYGLPEAKQEGHSWRTLHLAPPVHFDQNRSFWQQLGQPYNYYRRYHCASNARELKHVIDATHPDILLICEITGIGVISLLKALRELEIPIVFYLQSYLLLYARSPETKQSHLRARWLKKLLIGSIPLLTYTSLVAVSDAVKQAYMQDGYDPDRIEVIYNGVDSRFLKPLPIKTSQGKEDTELLYVGRLTTEKGVLIILKALDLLVNKQGRRNLHLNVFGDGDKSYISQLQSFIRDKQLTEIVTFYGKVPQDELIEHYDHSDIMLVSSIWQEPFALVTAEAMARGLPVIASKVGGTAERITHDVNGLLIEPGDERALASAITQLLENPEKLERLAQAARSTVQEHFTVEKCAQRMEQHLQQVIQGAHQ
ncbi:MAG TPA: glycosyltransferase family 4 protein [Ktedonobacteraceae bacterium]|nr:glycosyltransferase family 4 protein [Ktedonobacteraceae bacterium]